MSYQPLTLKYRPRTWSDLVGQETAVRTICNMLKMGNLMQSLIFGGSRGIGKTTSARILARTLNCEKRSADFEPCGECGSCIEIMDDRSLSVQEMDAASHGLVDDVRRIKEEVQYSSASNCRVYVIDECHSLTDKAWQAFLKLLEEPPPNVYFVFATTETHKIPDTIVSRSALFTFARMTIEHLVARLAYIAERESIKYEPGALHHIARHVNGGMRDAISLLDQLVSFTGGAPITKDAVAQVVGTMSTGLMFDLYRALVACDIHAVYSLLQQTYRVLSDVNVLVQDMAIFYRDMMLAKADVPVPDAQPDYLAALKDAGNLVTIEYLLQCQEHLQTLSEQVRRNRLPARTVVDVYITKLFYGGIRTSQQAPTTAPSVQVGPPRLVQDLVTPEMLAMELGGRFLQM